MPQWTFLLFFVVILTLDVLAHRFLYRRLFRDPGWSERARRVGLYAMVALAVLLPLGMATARFLPRSVAQPVAGAAFVWRGVLFYLLVILLAVELVRFGAGRLRRGPEVIDPGRRQILAQATAITAGTAAAGLSGVALRSGLAEVEVVEVGVKLERLPPALSGLTLVQLSDVHVGPTIGRRFMDGIVEKANGLRPDAVVITGDLVDGNVAALREHVEPLGRLAARYGVYFVTGNHEYYSGAVEWEAELKRLGIRVLRNERVRLGDAGASLDLAGVDDYRARGMAPGHGSDAAPIIAGRDPERELILLAHQPKSIVEAEKMGAGLQISGHTHGGQLFPFNFAVGLVEPYVAGLERHDERTQIYVSRGTGYWGPPMRMLAPAEITKIVLG